MSLYRETIDISKLTAEGYHCFKYLNSKDIDIDVSRCNLIDEVVFECDIQGNLEKVEARGKLIFSLELKCDRCDKDFIKRIESDFDSIYISDEFCPVDKEEARVYEEDLNVSYYSGGELELHEILKEQIYLAIPVKKLCDVNCLGLCSKCGKNLNEGRCGCEEEYDERLSELRKFLKKER